MARFELVTNTNRFDELAHAWDVLWREGRAPTFQSHIWLAAWVRHMERNFTLRIGLLWRDNARLAAILPMAIHKAMGVRILEWAGQSVSDYCDGLGTPEDVRTAWELMRKIPGVDIIRLKNIGPDATVTALFGSGLLPTDISLKVASNGIAGDAWFSTLNKKKRNNFNRGRRLLEEMGCVSVVCHETVPDEALVMHLLELKKAWLNAVKRRSSYVFEDDGGDRFRSLVQALDQLGRLRLFVITCNGRTVSASINFVEGSSLCAFFSAYDADFDRVSPGIMLMTAYTRWAFSNGLTEVDYLLGGESYKFEFANKETILSTFVAPETLRGHAALSAYRGLLRIGGLRGKAERLLRTGGAYVTKAGTPRKVAATDQREMSLL